MRHFKTISLVLAGALLLLHTFIPHQHHSELDEAEHIEQHQQADDLFDLLQLVFHIDLGGDHLEDFKTASFTFTSPDFFDHSVLERTYYSVQLDQFPTEFISDNSVQEIHSLQFRGPPAIA
ncbi:MAG: hypothetical protein ABJG47_03380 [Ekhidna sp.]